MLSEDRITHTLPISDYDRQYIVVAGERFFLPCALFGEMCIADWHSGDIAALTPENFSFCLQPRGVPSAEICILATGQQTQLLMPDLQVLLRRQGLAVECMRLDSACRSYNLLLSEYRRVAFAALNC